MSTIQYSIASLPHNMQHTNQEDAWHYLKTVTCAEFLQAIRIPGHLKILTTGRTQVIFPGYQQVFPGFILRDLQWLFNPSKP